MSFQVKEGDEVSGFIKGTNQLIEGLVFIRNDNTPVVLKEDRKWVRLSNLEHIKLLQEEVDNDTAREVVDGLISKIDPLQAEKQEDKVKQALGDFIKDDEDLGISSPEEADEIVNDQYVAGMAEAKANEGTGGNQQKAMDFLKTVEKDGAEEQLKESLADSLKDALGGESFDELWDEDDEDDEDEMPEPDDYRKKDIEDLFEPGADNSIYDDEEAQEEGKEAEDEDFSSISEEDRIDAIEEIYDRLDSNEEELIDWLLENYEIGKDEAEGILLEAYQKFVDNNSGKSGTLNDDTENDEVDAAYEEEIDSYDGDDVLEHLKDTFEIPEEKAKEIIKESHGMPEVILKFADYTRRHLS
jgi:hypothetical protein